MGDGYKVCQSIVLDKVWDVVIDQDVAVPNRREGHECQLLQYALAPAFSASNAIQRFSGRSNKWQWLGRFRFTGNLPEECAMQQATTGYVSSYGH